MRFNYLYRLLPHKLTMQNRPLSRCSLLFYVYVDCPPDLILELKAFCILSMLTDEAWRADEHEHKRITNH